MASESKAVEAEIAAAVEAGLPAARALAEGGDLAAAVESLLALEKKARLAAETKLTGDVAEAILELAFKAGDWAALQSNVQLLCKRRSQQQRVVGRVVKAAMSYLSETPDEETKIELLQCLRTVTAGKIHVEVERAELTSQLAVIREAAGDIDGACEVLQEVNVETFGAMELRDKAAFILEQFRLCLAKKDFVRAHIISKKISKKVIEGAEYADLKLKFYNLLIQYHTQQKDSLNLTRDWLAIFNTASVQEDDAEWTAALQNAVAFLVLSPFDNHQSDMMHRLSGEKKLQQLPQFAEVLKAFLAPEIVAWPLPQEAALATTTALAAGDSEEAQAAALATLHDRVIEHNLRVVSKYYSRITMHRLAALLDLPEERAEAVLCDLVSAKTLYAKIDRPAGIINFVKPQEPNEVLAEWAEDIGELLGLVERVCHLTHKETMIHKM